jgi:hypothetical protein
MTQDPARTTFTAPPNVRPYHPVHLPGDERRTFTDSHVQTWRQVGWHGQTGAFYALGEDPSRHEPGSYAPLWLLVDDEPRDET